MNKWLIIALSSITLILGSLLAITYFTTLSAAKWSDNGIDIVYGLVLLILVGFLYEAYAMTKDIKILLVLIGFFIISYDRIFEIFLQEFQISTNYSVLPWNWWYLNEIIRLLGVILIIKGLTGVKKE